MEPIRSTFSPGENNDNAELAVLASIEASLQETDVYENQVIREATHQLSPELEGIGFPSLDGLSPSFTNASNTVKNAATDDVPHVCNLLTKIRRQQQSSSDDILFLKEQILLNFLSTNCSVPAEDLPVRQQEEALEQKRSLYIQRQQQQKQPNGALLKSQGLSTNTKRRRQSIQELKKIGRKETPARISLMERKRAAHETQNEEENPFVIRKKLKAEDPHIALKQKKKLRALREERNEKKLERRRRRNPTIGRNSFESEEQTEEEWMSSSEDEEENEFEETEFTSSDNSKSTSSGSSNSADSGRIKCANEATSGTLASSSPAVDVKAEEDGSDEQPSSKTLRCPLCQEYIPTPDPMQADALLSQHINQCQRRRRSSRQSALTGTYLGRSASPTSAVGDTAKASTSAAGKRKSRKIRKVKKNRKKYDRFELPSTAAVDDLDDWVYEDRVDDWIESGLSRMKDMKERDKDDAPPGAEEYPGGLCVPAWINDRLFGYQRSALQWMWDLHKQGVGGIVGDEMGLGKTVQVCSFLGSMVASRKLKAVLIVVPATVLQHWLTELARWSPGLRRVLIHDSGEADGIPRAISANLLKGLANWLRQARADYIYEPIDEEDWESSEPHSFCGTGYAIVTTYENVRRNADLYSMHPWSYVILDEAQKIRNPDADVTLACKRIRTSHRLALSGTPIQNDLKELWSLFDFVVCKRLGTLPAFEQEFADPIRRGGYSNASPMQVQLAYRCAVVLRDLIEPYMLRRKKKEVKEVNQMPAKTEHVLFCRLTRHQRSLYEAYIASDDVSKVLRGSFQLLAAITVLRKICNHPDLVCADQSSVESFLKFGRAQNNTNGSDDSSDLGGGDYESEELLMERSGKLEVLAKILPLWRKQGHRVLIFCQWRKMLDIIQRFTILKNWKFGRLDGNTNVAARQKMVDTFNSDESYFGMLCTTRTGGVGLNLTGANRIILYDPDWNPQTDAQARERAWRFGQEREVTIYRLITAGTVEEKIYQRQIFKTALSNKILQDPRQRRLFSHRDLKDLFTLKADAGSVRSGGDGLTETGAMTKGVGVVAPDDEPAEESSQDNEEILKKVMKSKGLAGVFDHHFLEHDSSRKSATVREMEDQAKRVAQDAVRALRQSVSTNDPFEPTWTGSEETEPRRFGSSQGVTRSRSSFGGSTTHSDKLLANLRERNAAVKSAGKDGRSSDNLKQYTKLLARMQKFVRHRSPTTDEILKEFDNVPHCDVAIFRRLLKSIAVTENGRWYLK